MDQLETTAPQKVFLLGFKHQMYTDTIHKFTEDLCRIYNIELLGVVIDVDHDEEEYISYWTKKKKTRIKTVYRYYIKCFTTPTEAKNLYLGCKSFRVGYNFGKVEH